MTAMVLPSEQGTVMEQVVAAAGFDAAMKICAAWGGRTLYVPDAITESHPIAEEIGIKAAQALVHVFGSQTIQPPKMEHAHIRRRRHARLLMQKGLHRRIIADIIGVSERQVRNLVSDRQRGTGDPGNDD